MKYGGIYFEGVGEEGAFTDGCRNAWMRKEDGKTVEVETGV